MDVKRLIAQAMAPLHKRIAELEAEVARLKKNSSNSSKPPSSDITKPPQGRFDLAAAVKEAARCIGGQPSDMPSISGRSSPPEQIDHTLTYASSPR